MGLASSPFCAAAARLAWSVAIPVPPPPNMYDGRTMTGYPTLSPISSASSRPLAKPESGTAKPISVMAALNSPLSSAVAMAAASAPIISTP